MRNTFLLSCFLASFSLLLAQTPKVIINQDGDLHPWNHLDFNNAESSFQFAIVTDRTGGHRPGIFPDAVQKLNLLQPEFVMSVGDLIEGYTTDEARIDREWEEFTGFIDELTVPFFYVPGNHDYINEVMAKKWKERFGKDYYHFVYQDVLFLCLNSEERMRGAGRGYIDEPQLAYIQQTLQAYPDVKWTLAFLHQPLWDQADNGLWPEVEKLLANRPHTVFAGHRHRYVKYEQNNGKYFVLATTGGGSGLRGPRFGEFDHVVWVTMTEQGPVIANLMLDGIWDENVNTEEIYAVSRPLMGMRPFELSPVLQAEELFAGTSTELRIKNDSDVPMKVQLKAVSNEDVWVAMDPFEQVIAPNSVELVELPLRPQGKGITPLYELSPVELMATATFQPANQPELEMNFSYLLKPEVLHPLPEAPRRVKVDGDLKEWNTLKYRAGEAAYVDATPFAHKGLEDCTFQFDVREGKNHLYLAAEVTDDQLEVSEGGNPYNQDGLAFLLDARPLNVSANGRGEGLFREVMVLAFSPTEEGALFRADRMPEGLEWACKKTETGYQIEAAVPFAYLNEQQGGEWKHLRLNVIARDMDLEGMHNSTLSWEPAWDSDENRLGSGTFGRR